MRVWVTCGIIVVAVVVALMPVVAYFTEGKVSGSQMAMDMKTFIAVVKEMGPAFKDVDISLAPDRSRMIVSGTVPSDDDRTRLRNKLKSTPIGTPLSRVTFDVKVGEKH